MKLIIPFLFVGIFIVPVQSTLGIDLSTYCNNFSCLKQYYQFAIPRAWLSYGAADSNAPQNIKNAKNAGFQYVDVYMFPCRAKSATTQVNALIDYLNDHLYGNGTIKYEPMQPGDISVKGLQAGTLSKSVEKQDETKFFKDIKIANDASSWRKKQDSNDLYGQIWLDIEINPSCGWGTDYNANCNYLQELISAVKARGKAPGVYSSIYMWESIMGSLGACQSVASGVPLWYAHYDNSPSFSDYQQIGGWSYPNIKQYKGDTSECGQGIDLNYY